MNKHLIMVVEDEIEYANRIANAIRNTGKYDVFISHSAKEALGYLEINKSPGGPFQKPRALHCP
ncbi:MAG: hypothetical protein KJ732_06215 [Candidatus Margulisbacteria bacterium]|nr:hypothetical protein [Candidatus Margulisiibacteriota bacterium]